MFSLWRVRNILLSGCLFSLVGCASTTIGEATAIGHAQAQGAGASMAATSADSLAQTGWELTRWVSSTNADRWIPHGNNGQPVQLVFLAQGKEYRVNGYSGCNRYSGDYRLQHGKLSIFIQGSTRMACVSPELAQLEKAYLQALANIRTFTLDSGGAPRHLTFNLNNGDVLEFVRRQDPPTPQ